MSEYLIEAHQIHKKFPVREGFFQRSHGEIDAVHDVTLKIRKGETHGLVGESGSGKSTLGRCLMRLTDINSGKILFKGEDITDIRGEPLRKLRKNFQIVFQDPYSSLNPKMTVQQTLEEPLIVHSLFHSKKDRIDRILELLYSVGLHRDHLNRLPHEFSGGQRQRIGIARALAAQPDLIVCDEPVSSLDVSIQAQIINLMKDLQQSLGLTYLFIAHDLKVVQHVSDRVSVMYLGKIVEEATSIELYKNPQHPYTRALFQSIPSLNPRMRNKNVTLLGEIPSSVRPPDGCRFHPRCSKALSKCKSENPQLIATENHSFACFNP